MRGRTRYRPLLQRALCPRPFVLISLLLLSAVSLTAVFTLGYEESAAAGAVYAISAYTTVAAALRCVALGKQLRTWLRSQPLFHRYLSDMDYKARLSLFLSLSVTLLYCVYKAFLGLRYRSLWFGAAASYYLVLAILRLFLLRHINGGQKGCAEALKKYRLCGYLLLLLTAALGAMNFYTIRDSNAAMYPGHTIYAVAGFAFYNLTMAIVNLIRCRKRRHSLCSASNILTLAAALVSMFQLQTSLFAAFGDGGLWQRYMSIATGGGVFLLITGMALLMIRGGERSLAALAAQNDEI